MKPLLGAWLAVVCLAATSFGPGPKARADKKGFPPSAANSIALSPDGKTLAIAEARGAIRLWDVAKAQTQFSFPVGSSTHEPIRSMAFSPDGKALALVGHKSRVELWEVASGKRRVAYQGHLNYATRVVFSPDGKTLYSCGNDGTQREPVGIIRVWDTATGREKALLRGHRGDVIGLAVAANGKLLASGCFRGDVKLWDAEAYREVAEFAHKSSVYSVALSADSKRLLSGGRGATLWDVTTRQHIGDFGGNQATISRVAFSPDGRLVVSEDSVRRVAIWDPNSFRQLTSFPFDGVFGCVVTPDSRTLIGCRNKDGAVQTWEMGKLTAGTQ